MLAMVRARTEVAPSDVLAAEEFVVPAPDPGLTPERLELPTDLVGGEPRDVLAAEEFAMPAPDEARVRFMSGATRSLPGARRGSLVIGLAVVLWWGLLRRRRRSPRG
jgi:hypothetical protein